MNEMIERVAAAILAAASNMDCYDDIATRKDQFALARAAVGAMRNPPEAITEAMFREMGSPSDGGYCDEAWAAAIDEILK